MALAITYRPESLGDVVGQDHVTSVLEKMLQLWAAGRLELPASLLFSGPRGSGKTSTARIVASSLNCNDVVEGIGCAECADCLAVQNGTSQSVMEIDAASHGLVADTRELNQIARLSHPGKCRVFIIDEVHSASKEAFSALLKQLEEPPSNVLYILVTTEVHSIPSTIQSRCLSFNFMSLTIDDILMRLQDVVMWEDIDVEEACLRLIAERAKGSLRDALMMLEQLSILEEVTVERFEKLWPDELSDFAQVFLTSAQAGIADIGIKAIRQSFLIHRDVGLLTDAVLLYLSEQTLSTGSKYQKGVIPLRSIPALIKIAWELRVRSRALNPTDPVLLEALWQLYAGELSNGLTSVSKPLTLDEEVSFEVVESTSPLLGSASDLDAILSEK